MVIFKKMFFSAALLLTAVVFMNPCYAQNTPSAQIEPVQGGMSAHDALLSPDTVPKASGTHTPLQLSPMPDTPTHFAIEPGNGTALLKWDPMPRAVGYMIFGSEDGHTFKRRFNEPVKSAACTIGLLRNGLTYYFGVASVAEYGKKSHMAVQSVTPNKP